MNKNVSSPFRNTCYSIKVLFPTWKWFDVTPGNRIQLFVKYNPIYQQTNVVYYYNICIIQTGQKANVLHPNQLEYSNLLSGFLI